MDCSRNFWKIDKIDKVFISIILIFVTFFCLFQNFVFASSYYVHGTILNSVGYTGYPKPILIEDSTRYGIYYRVYPGFTYTFDFPYVFNFLLISTFDVPSVGVICSSIDVVSFQSYTVTIPDGINYVFVCTNREEMAPTNENLLVTTNFSNYDNVIFSLSKNVGISNIWNTFEIAIPYILVVVLVSFGFYLIFHAIREISRGRDT